jgi:hypothetical protein
MHRLTQNSPRPKNKHSCLASSSRPCLWIKSVIWSSDKITRICSDEKTRTLAWQMDSLQWQCLCSWCLPYLLYLAPCDFWFFPKLKDALKGQRFAGIPDIQPNVTNCCEVSGLEVNNSSFYVAHLNKSHQKADTQSSLWSVAVLIKDRAMDNMQYTIITRGDKFVFWY